MKQPAKTNHKFPCALTFLCSCALVLLCSFVSAQAKVLPETARLIPPETVLLVNIDNFGELKEQFEKTNLYKLYKDPAMAAFVEDFKTKWRQKMRQLNNKVAEAIIDADVLPQGRVAVALVLNEQSGEDDEPTILFITQWDEKTGEIKEVVDKMVKKAIEEGSHRNREDYRGVSITTIIGENSSRLSYCLFDDCLIVSTNLEVLKFVIAHIKGASSPALAGDTDYTDTIKATGPYHDIDFYVNIKQIIKTIIAEDSTGETQTKIANLGLDNVAAFGCSIGLGRRPGTSFSSKAFLKINGAKKGIFKMLEFESAGFRAPRFIPALAYSVSFLNLNIKKAYDELYNILHSFDHAAAAIMHTRLLPPSPDGQPGLELKSGIIDHLGSQIIVAQSTKKPFSTDSVPTETLIAVAVVNSGALEKSISVLYSKMNPDARRELLGHTIYLVTLPGLPFLSVPMTPMQGPADSAVRQIPKMAFTITETHLIFGVESTVERAIRTLSSTEAASVGSAKWFTSAKLPIPSVVGLAGLQDNVASAELWWMMKEAEKSKSKGKDSNFSMGFGMSSKPGLMPGLMFSQAGLFDAGLLPEFDAVRKYFGVSALYGISRPDGFFFELKYLNRVDTD